MQAPPSMTVWCSRPHRAAAGRRATFGCWPRRIGTRVSSTKENGSVRCRQMEIGLGWRCGSGGPGGLSARPLSSRFCTNWLTRTEVWRRSRWRWIGPRRTMGWFGSAFVVYFFISNLHLARSTNREPEYSQVRRESASKEAHGHKGASKRSVDGYTHTHIPRFRLAGVGSRLWGFIAPLLLTLYCTSDVLSLTTIHRSTTHDLW